MVKTTRKTEEGKAMAKLQRTRNSQKWRRDEYQELPGNHRLKPSKSFHEISLNGHTNCMHTLSQVTDSQTAAIGLTRGKISFQAIFSSL